MIDHDAIDKIVKPGGYGRGVVPNPLAYQCKEWERRKMHWVVLEKIQSKIVSLYEPRFISSPEVSEAIAALVTMTDSRVILELGTHVGFTTYHMLKSVYGKPGAKIVTVDPRPAHDADFFAEFSSIMTHVNGWTPQCLKTIGGPFQFVFIDSQHTVEHTASELEALMSLTYPGSILVFHDVPAWQTPDNRTPAPVREWLLNNSKIRGLCLPTGEQADCLMEWGEGYPKETNPGLGIFVRL